MSGPVERAGGKMRKRVGAFKSKGRRSNLKVPQRSLKSSKREVGTLENFQFYARLLALAFVLTVIVLIGVTLFPLLAPFHRRRWRVIANHIQALALNSFIWLCPKADLQLHGQLPDASTKPKVIICNHATEVDWLYLCMLARVTNNGTTDRTGNVKILLKEEVRHIPIIGWGCSVFEFIYLKRDWTVDKKRIEDSLKAFVRDEEPLWLFIFPEGSTVNTRTMEKCNNWARKTNPPRPELNYTLLPRSRGLDHIMQVLHEETGQDPELYDMTMTFDGYSGEVPTWEMGYKRNIDVKVPNFAKLFFGSSSRKCHVESTKFSYKQVKQEHPETLERWLDERWVRKEKLLKGFGQKSGFCTEECGDPFVVPISATIWPSVVAVAFYACMWFGMGFTYLKYSTEGDAFFQFL